MPFNHFQMIGDGRSDWMTEKVDLSSFVSTSASSPGSSLPPSPPERHVKAPSDLEVMTSLLQEELAQLEDYFRSESCESKSSKCDKAMGSPSYYQFPYGSYGGGQSESSPVVVTLATGDLDLAVSRSKIARPAPYNYHHHHHHHHHHRSGRRVLGEEAEAWRAGSYSGSAEYSINHYSALKAASKSGVKKVRECALSLKEEESYCFSEGMFCSEEIARSFCSYEHKSHKVNLSYGAGEHWSKDAGLPTGVPQETAMADGYFHQSLAAEPYHGFMSDLEQPAPAEPQHGHYLYPECLADQSYECLSEATPAGAPAQRGAHRLKDQACSVKSPACLDVSTGERKQKKRDQNKTAAHRYRLRKRAELDSLEEELHGLEGQNRELRDKAESVEREIQYVKDLLIEVYKARSQRLKQDGGA
ncbi:uncharacterized protein LOC133564838 isoform X1 [Nerophis ophidion]|uniref:uncharacterized protein LOC133564838 isoform X1 n=1 Tax=Nerophis ophidion TaxID=159077 RepID=UPI002ADF4AFE|nr:uncharacterized protein LOC133564838 isoform X1 [Nerophis ophidion]